MNIDTLLKFFVPKDHKFFPLFEDDAKNMVKAALLLKELMITGDSVAHEKIYAEIKKIEHIGDEITNSIYEQLNKSFITPFDREDIHELAANIDDVVDSINGIGRRLCLYKPVRAIPAYVEMAELILKAAFEIEKAVHCLKDPVANIKLITEACSMVKDIEHEADDKYFISISELFRNESDPKELIKNNKILENLERCVDAQEDVTDTLKTILIKMA